MTTPIYITGFESWPDTPTVNGSGLCTQIAGSPTVVTSHSNTGARSLQINPSSATEYIRLSIAASNRVLVGRVYIKFVTLPTDRRVVDIYPGFTSARIGPDTNGKWAAQIGGGTTVTDTVGPSAGTWYRVDFKVDTSNNPVTLDWKIDGTTKTQASASVAAADIQTLYLGQQAASTCEYYLDDLVLSYTSGDYPIGAGGTQALAPASDGTHNAGTNIMEDNAGNDINGTTVTAYNKINSVPPNSTAYILQNGNGTANYAEVLFGNISATHNGIIGAQAILAYTSATTTGNNGGCIVSKDDFSTSTTVWGAAGALADYSDGATNNLYYKSAIVAGVTDDTTVNALEARVGYSGDAAPDPYWIDLLIEVAYTVATATVYTLTAEAGSFAVTGVDPALLFHRSLDAGAGSFSLTGIDATLAKSYPLTAEAGTFTLSSVDASLLFYRSLTAEAGSYTTTGIDSTLLFHRILGADAGSVSVSGVDVSLLFHRVLNADTGQYVVTGIDVTLTYNGGGLVYTLDAAAGSFALTGVDATLLNHRTLTAGAGSIAVTGIDASLLLHRILSAGAGGISLTGQDASLLRNWLMSAEAGNYTLAGIDADFILTTIIEAIVRTWTIRNRSAGVSLATRDIAFLPRTRTTAETLSNRTTQTSIRSRSGAWTVEEGNR